jgi:hypothetical protein
MADLTIGEVGNTLQLNLVNIDQSQTPPAATPLNLSGATQVQLSFVICDTKSKPLPPSKQVNMTITNPSGGIVQYVFVAGDLAAPPSMGKDGVFRYSVQVTFNTGLILISADDGLLTIKNDSTL